MGNRVKPPSVGVAPRSTVRSPSTEEPRTARLPSATTTEEQKKDPPLVTGADSTFALTKPKKTSAHSGVNAALPSPSSQKGGLKQRVLEETVKLLVPHIKPDKMDAKIRDIKLALTAAKNGVTTEKQAELLRHIGDLYGVAAQRAPGPQFKELKNSLRTEKTLSVHQRTPERIEQQGHITAEHARHMMTHNCKEHGSLRTIRSTGRDSLEKLKSLYQPDCKPHSTTYINRAKNKEETAHVLEKSIKAGSCKDAKATIPVQVKENAGLENPVNQGFEGPALYRKVQELGINGLIGAWEVVDGKKELIGFQVVPKIPGIKSLIQAGVVIDDPQYQRTYVPFEKLEAFKEHFESNKHTKENPNNLIENEPYQQYCYTGDYDRGDEQISSEGRGRWQFREQTTTEQEQSLSRVDLNIANNGPPEKNPIQHGVQREYVANVLLERESIVDNVAQSAGVDSLVIIANGKLYETSNYVEYCGVMAALGAKPMPFVTPKQSDIHHISEVSLRRQSEPVIGTPQKEPRRRARSLPEFRQIPSAPPGLSKDLKPVGAGGRKKRGKKTKA